MPQISAVVAAKDGSAGVFATEFEGAFAIPNRDALGVSLRIRIVDHDNAFHTVIVFSDTYSHDYVAKQLGMTGLSAESLQLEFALARLGDVLDEQGWRAWTEGGGRRVEVTCYSRDFDAWFARRPADEEAVVTYLASKVYWAWRYDQPSAAVVEADLIRLRRSWTTVDRMAQLGDGLRWKRDPGSRFFVPEPNALREYHTALTAPIPNDVPLRMLLAAPRYRGPREHWAKTLDFMSADSRDFANATKEAVCAVEGVARIVLSDDSATLGQLLKDMKAKRGVDPALIKSIEGIWGFASNEPGVRHGATDQHNVPYEKAQYVISTAEAAIRLMLGLDK